MKDEMEKILLFSKVKKNLLLTHTPVGYLAGWKTEKEIFCTTMVASTSLILPGLEIIGFFCMANKQITDENELLSMCTQKFGSLKLNMDTSVVLIVHKDEAEGVNLDITAKLYSPYYESLNDLNVVDADANPSLLVRARGRVPLVLEVASDSDTLRENIELGIERIRSTFQSQVTAFLLSHSNYLIHSSQGHSSGDLTLKEMQKLYLSSDVYQKKSKKSSKKKVPLNFDILLQTTGEAALENTFNHSVVIHCQRREFRCVHLSLPLDVIVVALEATTTQDLYKLLQTAIDKQFVQISQCLIADIKSTDIPSPEVYHFYPDLWEFPMTLIYPRNKTDKELETYRKDLHEQLLLPTDRPFLKRLNSHDFSNKSTSGLLFNPHEGIVSNSVIGGKIATVQGRYTYHHYMQDHMNDNGWGCAYRSLQTIVSWFKYQGYNDVAIPSHKEIQEALVAVGDKPETFIGSNKWIGSQEVSFCLNHLLQVESKIMFVSSGAELATKGRELFNHFNDQGTPVMIGGGVLAHTILGVDFNQNTGDLKFLILDPHYTGSEDLSTILSKGWCGWKGIQFWDQNAFYNLCLPQKPVQI